MNDHPYFAVKITLETHYKITSTHEIRRDENIIPTMRFSKEIDAVKSAIDALRERYHELERDEDE